MAHVKGAAPASFKHVAALDGFRAIAVLIVMLSHAGFEKLVPGAFGVTIFFFLSGYLIISLLRAEQAENGGVSLSGFYFRRTLRIFPPLFITIAIAWLISFVGAYDYVIPPGAVLRDALFLTNYPNFWPAGDGLPIALWSLDVEEHFYILFSLAFVLLFAMMKPAHAALCCASLCVLILAGRIGLVATIGVSKNIQFWSHTRFDSILFGGCLALWQNPRLDGPTAWRPRAWHIGLAAAVLAASFIIRDPAFRDTFRFTLQGVALFIIFSAVLHDRGIVSRVMGSTPLKWIGLLSYSLYLGHAPIVEVLRNVAPDLPRMQLALLMLLGSLIYALLLYILVERPLARWRARRSARLRGVGEPLVS